MSSALYTTRLLWTGRLGLAKAAGVMVEFTAIPFGLLPSLHIAEMDYVPEVRKFEIRQSGQCWRPMSADEIRATGAFLQRVAAAARNEIERST